MGYKTDLVSWWSLDETSGTRVDSHGSNDLADNNTVLYGTGVQSNAGDFEAGNSEYLDIADNASLSVGDIAFTWAQWIKIEDKSVRRVWLGKLDTTGANVELEYSVDYSDTTDRFRFIVGDGTNSGIVNANNLGSPSIATWYFIIGWHDPDANKIYIQGNDGTVDETAWTTGVQDLANKFSIGRMGEYDGLYADGLIDEVGFWKRLLTSTERTWLYNSGSGRAYSELAATFSGAGTLSLGGTMQITTLWKRLQSGALALSGALGPKSLRKRALAGLLQLSGAMDGFRRQFQSMVGTLRFSLGRLQTTVLWKRLVAGTLTFSSLLIGKIPKFVIATIRLCLRPVAVVRTWLNPDADVDIV